MYTDEDVRRVAAHFNVLMDPAAGKKEDGCIVIN